MGMCAGEDSVVDYGVGAGGGEGALAGVWGGR